MRRMCVSALGNIGDDGNVVSILDKCLNDENMDVRINAVFSLGKIAMDDNGAVESLIAALKRDEDGLYIYIESAVERSKEVDNAIRMLIDEIDNNEPVLVWRICYILGFIGRGRSEVLRALEALSVDRNGLVKEEALKAIERIRA